MSQVGYASAATVAVDERGGAARFAVRTDGTLETTCGGKRRKRATDGALRDRQRTNKKLHMEFEEGTKYLYVSCFSSLN